MNTPGTSDGQIRGWLDGTASFSRSGVALRRSDEGHVGIREMWLNVYFGGKFPTPNDLSLVIDQIEVSTEGRVGCLDPFTDDNANVHVNSITELHALGFLYGCGHRKACPDLNLTRGDMAAFFSVCPPQRRTIPPTMRTASSRPTSTSWPKRGSPKDATRPPTTATARRPI